MHGSDAKSPPTWIIFTDLDGTLLDDAYDIENACLTLDEVTGWGNVCIPVTSKSYLEVVAINRLRARPAPIIFENGAGIAWPHQSGPEILGKSAAVIREVLKALRSQQGFEFRGFADMTVAELRGRTGLDKQSAADALRRSASEPLVWQDSEAAFTRFTQALDQDGLKVVLGGRFFCVMDAQCDKATACKYLVSKYSSDSYRPKVLACGDAPNDIDMLASGDVALVFPQREGGWLEVPAGPRIHRVSTPGHLAWLSSVKHAVLAK